MIPDDVLQSLPLTGKMFLRFLMQIGDSQPGGQDGIIGVFRCQSSCRFRCQAVQLLSRHTRVEAIDYFQGDGNLSIVKLKVTYP